MGQITQPKGGNEVFYAAPLPSRLMSAKLSRNMMLVFSYNEIRNILFYCPTFQNVSWSVLVTKLWQQPTIFCVSLSPFCLFTLVRASFAQFLNVTRWNLGSRLKCHIVAIGEKNRQVCPQRSNSPWLSYKIARFVAGLNCYEFNKYMSQFVTRSLNTWSEKSSLEYLNESCPQSLALLCSWWTKHLNRL